MLEVLDGSEPAFSRCRCLPRCDSMRVPESPEPRLLWAQVIENCLQLRDQNLHIQCFGELGRAFRLSENNLPQRSDFVLSFFQLGCSVDHIVNVSHLIATYHLRIYQQVIARKPLVVSIIKLACFPVLSAPMLPPSNMSSSKASITHHKSI